MNRQAAWVFFGQAGSGVDSLGRPKSITGRSAIQRVLAAASSQPVTQLVGSEGLARRNCHVVQQADYRLRCAQCGRWWSVSHVQDHFVVAVSEVPIGIDIEVGRHRPRAWRHASRWCTEPITSPARWTQAEALWKVSGKGKRKPLYGEIVLPREVSSDWQYVVGNTQDVGVLITTRERANTVWSVAIESSDNESPEITEIDL